MDSRNAASTLDYYYLIGSVNSTIAAAPSTFPIALAPRPLPLPPPPPALPRPAARYAVAQPPPLPPPLPLASLQIMDSEMDTMAALLPRYPYITIDTEYAGVVHRPPAPTPCPSLPPHQRYALVKANVNDVPVVQLGITLCDAHGNIPLAAAGGGEIAWEVTFSDFDARRHRHAPDSVKYLRSQGIGDLDHGMRVSSAAFAAKLAAVVSAEPNRGELTWAAFGGAHDFGYLVKMLSAGRPLPETWHEFMAEAKALLGGGRVFDAKYMAEHYCGRRADLCRGGGGGGLRRVAASLGVWRHVPGWLTYLAARKSHTACLVYAAMRRLILDGDGGGAAGTMAMLEGLIDGLQW